MTEFVSTPHKDENGFVTVVIAPRNSGKEVFAIESKLARLGGYSVSFKCTYKGVNVYSCKGNPSMIAFVNPVDKETVVFHGDMTETMFDIAERVELVQ